VRKKMTPILCVIFAAVGLVEDYIVSRYYRAIAEKKAIRSSVISFVHTLLAIFVVASIIKGNSIPLLICYATGGAVGTWIGVRR
jgi:hypothetical protein